MRVAGRVTRARALTVRSPVSRVPLRTTAAAGMPKIVPRSGWQADEAIRRAKPVYADTLRMAHVHHTAGTNTYTRLQAPAVVRAIQLYHVEGNGWNDIGYNALVDRYGTVYEGRYGGIDRNVVGAHARGFNTGSFGIAVMGDFRTADPPAAAVDALVRTLAWRLDAAHVDALSTFNGISSGNERFGAGIPVFLRVVSGHRDTGLTTCPGERLYAQLPAIARRVAALGLPKLYSPSATPEHAGRHPAHCSTVVRASLDGGRDRRRRRRARPRRGNRRRGRLDVGARGRRSRRARAGGSSHPARRPPRELSPPLRLRCAWPRRKPCRRRSPRTATASRIRPPSRSRSAPTRT